MSNASMSTLKHGNPYVCLLHIYGQWEATNNPTAHLIDDGELISSNHTRARRLIGGATRGSVRSLYAIPLPPRR